MATSHMGHYIKLDNVKIQVFENVSHVLNAQSQLASSRHLGLLAFPITKRSFLSGE